MKQVCKKVKQCWSDNKEVIAVYCIYVVSMCSAFLVAKVACDKRLWAAIATGRMAFTKKLEDGTIVIINNDEWLKLGK